MDDAGGVAGTDGLGAAEVTDGQAAVAAPSSLGARLRVRRAVRVAAAALVALWLGDQQSFTWQSYLGVAAVSAWSLAWAASGRTPRAPPPRRLHPLGIAAWSVPVLAFSALEIVDDRLGSTLAHPTLSSAMDPVLEHPLWRTLAVAAWLLAGRALVRR